MLKKYMIKYCNINASTASTHTNLKIPESYYNNMEMQQTITENVTSV